MSGSTIARATASSSLQTLRCKTKVDCDTLDAHVAELYGPFEDCTSNQAIAYAELKTGKHEALLQESARVAARIHAAYPDLKLSTLAGEVATIALSLHMVPHLNGFNHIQVNTLHSDSADAMVQNALRIRAISSEMTTSYDTSRLCIKIPATWHGLRACRILEKVHNMRTLATTLFGVVQASVAAEAGCRYIAPYVHSLPDVMGIQAPDSPAQVERMMSVAFSMQDYYMNRGLSTQVLPAALMHADECLTLAGVDHITLSPARLQELDVLKAAAEDGMNDKRKLVASNATESFEDLQTKARSMIEDETLFLSALDEEANGIPMASMKSALAIFNEKQLDIDQLMSSYC